LVLNTESLIIVILVFLIVFVLGILLLFRQKVPGKEDDYSRIRRRNNRVMVVIILFFIIIYILNVFSEGKNQSDILSNRRIILPAAVLFVGLLSVIFLIIGGRKKRK